MKVRETMKTEPQGFAQVVHTVARVIEVPDGTKLHRHQEQVPDDTKVSDWESTRDPNVPLGGK